MKLARSLFYSILAACLLCAFTAVAGAFAHVLYYWLKFGWAFLR